MEVAVATVSERKRLVILIGEEEGLFSVALCAIIKFLVNKNNVPLKYLKRVKLCSTTFTTV